MTAAAAANATPTPWPSWPAAPWKQDTPPGRRGPPQLTVTVDLDSLLGHPGALGGEVGGAGPLDPQACQRLACDAAVTGVLVTRHPTSPPSPNDPSSPPPTQDPNADHRPPTPSRAPTPRPTRPPGTGNQPAAQNPSRTQGLTGRWPPMALLPPALGGAADPSRWRSAGPAGSSSPPNAAPGPSATAAVSSDCDRPLAWCEAHHLRHWLHGGPTNLANLALLCRVHHRAVHEGGWRLTRGPDGRLTTTPPHRAHPRHRVAA